MSTELVSQQHEQSSAERLPISTLCKHCNSPVPRTGEQFCCAGCRFVYETLEKFGLKSFYSIQRAQGKITLPPAVGSSDRKDYRYLDDPGTLEKLTEDLPNALRSIQFYLPTIHCAACVWLLEKMPTFAEGVTGARVNFREGRIRLTYRPDSILLSELASLLSSIGYPPVPYTPNVVEEEAKKEERQMLRRIGVAGLCAANTMMLAVSLFQGYFSGMEEPYNSLFRWTSALIAIPAVTYSAVPFYRTAIGSLFSGTLHIDLPISLAIIGATAAGFVTLFAGGEYLYFDSVTTLIFLLLLGRYIQRRAIHQARASTLSSWELFPASARCVEEGRVVEKPLSDLRIGDVLEILPNERIPTDGTVTAGESSVESAFLTGESAPLFVRKDSTVLGGTLNIDGRLWVRVGSLGASTRLGKILHQLEEQQQEKPALENEVNRLSSAFILGVLALCLGTYAAWSFIQPNRAFDAAVAILIVTCPCALGLAIPAAVSVAMAAAQRARLFVKRADSLERLAKAESFYFDKTGTLTEGELRVTFDWLPFEHVSIAHALAAFSPVHPTAKAVCAYYKDDPVATLASAALIPGRGVTGVRGDKTYRLGSLSWFRELGLHFSPELSREVEEAAALGTSVLGFAEESSVTGYILLEDRIRPEAKALVAELQRMGKNVFILSGDLNPVVQSFACGLSIPPQNAFGELLPEQKAAIVSRGPGASAFIGDGMNDAPALRASSVGVGLRGGLEATLECADIFVGDRDLAGFSELYHGALKVQSIIRRNLRFAVAYNILGAGAAVFGLVTPLVASFLMPASSLTVIVSSIAESYFKRGNAQCR